MPYTVSIAPTDSHSDRYLTSSHPGRCLYAMMADTPGLVCCVLQQSDYVRSCAFLVFDFLARTWSCLLLIGGHHCCTRTPSRKSLPQAQFALYRARLTQGNTHGSLSPECLWHVSQRHFFFHPPILLYVFM